MNSIEKIKDRLESKSTQELMDFYLNGKEDEWTPQAFEAMAEILKERGQNIPQVTSKLSYNAADDLKALAEHYKTDQDSPFIKNLSTVLNIIQDIKISSQKITIPIILYGILGPIIILVSFFFYDYTPMYSKILSGISLILGVGILFRQRWARTINYIAIPLFLLISIYLSGQTNIWFWINLFLSFISWFLYIFLMNRVYTLFYFGYKVPLIRINEKLHKELKRLIKHQIDQTELIESLKQLLISLKNLPDDKRKSKAFRGIENHLLSIFDNWHNQEAL